jgi:hypothetical protein
VSASLFAAFSLFAAPQRAAAQAAPGPMHPAPQSSSNDPTGYGDVTVSHRPPPRPAYKTDLAGVWKFDQDDSDDILEKLKEAREGSGGRDDGSNGNGQNSPRSNNGGIHMGGMGSPYPGGTGSGGGNNGAGNPRSRGANGSPSSELSVNNPEIEEYTTPAGQLTFLMKDNEIDLTDDSSRQRTYFTDDRRVAKAENQKPSDPKQFDAYWEDVKLVSKDELPHSVRVTREFTPQPGGRQLIEHVTIETNHSNGYVELNLAYDRVGQVPAPPPPTPKTQTASAPANDGAPHAITSVSTPNGTGANSGSSDPNAPPATVPNATQSGTSDAPTLKRPTSPQ